MTNRVVNGVHNREDFQQQRLLPCATAEIRSNRLNEFFPMGADGFEKLPQVFDASPGIGCSAVERRFLGG